MRLSPHPVDVALASLQHLARQRRRLGIWLVGRRGINPSVLEALQNQRVFRIADLLVELLPRLTDDSEKPLGVFGPDDLADWILHLSYVANSPPILINEVEPILATFRKPEAERFFQLAANLDPRAPVVIISHVGELIEAAGFPDDRIWRIAD